MKELEEKILEILYRNKRYSRDSKETAREIVELFEQKEPSAEEKAKIIKAWREDTGVLICNTEKELDVPSEDEVKEHNPYPHPVSDAQMRKGVGFIIGAGWAIAETKRRNKWY